MATSSFTQNYEIKREDAKKLLNIINDKSKVRVQKVEKHMEVKGSAVSKFLGLERK